MRLFVILAVFVVGCGAPAQQQEETAPLEPMFDSRLPDPPEEVPPNKRMVVPVSECVLEGSEPPEKTPPGILMSEAMAMRSARLKVAYDEMRGLYEVDLRTMDRERQVYEKQLGLADQEISEWREKARRTWWERNKGLISLGIGLAVGAGFAVGMAAALDGVTDAVE